MLKNPKNRWKLIKIANIDRESLHIFWITGRTSVKLKCEICENVKDVTYDNIKSHKKSSFHPPFRETFLEKPQFTLIKNNYSY